MSDVECLKCKNAGEDCGEHTPTWEQLAGYWMGEAGRLADEIERLREALQVIATGEGCMNGMREELDAATLRKLAKAALKGNQ